MRKNIKLALIILLMPSACFCQQAMDIINKVKLKQHTINTLSYTINRTDTLGNIIRHMDGTVVLEKNVQDTIFGFKFWARKTKDPIEKVFDGHVGYTLNTNAATYEITTSPSGIYNLLNGGGGHLVLPDVMKLDTAKVIKTTISEDETTYLLIFRYPDIEEYDVTKKFKAVRIKKQSMLPVSVRIHQESLGRIQDLYYEISNLKINVEHPKYNFSALDFLKDFQHIVSDKSPSPVFGLMGSSLPSFKLGVFSNGKGWVSAQELKNKPVLLDFWEVWCAPCVESMPKIEDMFKKYHDKGLHVYGIINDTANIASSKILIKRKEITFPMLIGNEQLKSSFKIAGIPLYILIDKQGKIVFISEGFSNDLEAAIIKVLEK